MTDDERYGGLATALYIAYCGLLALVLRGVLAVLYVIMYSKG